MIFRKVRRMDSVNLFKSISIICFLTDQGLTLADSVTEALDNEGFDVTETSARPVFRHNLIPCGDRCRRRDVRGGMRFPLSH